MLLRQGIRELRRRLPPGWLLGEPQEAPDPIDACIRLSTPDGRAGLIALEQRARLDPKGVLPLAEARRAAELKLPLLVISRYLSEATRERLRSESISYLDLTGNARLVVAEPGLFIETQGASEDPEREERPARSLRGPKAGRIVRALIDRREPPGVRELAAATRIDAGYVSRVLSFLDTEALIHRGKRGRIESVDWPALLRRWAREAPLEDRGEARACLEPRGLPALVARLAKSKERYVISGTLAAQAWAQAAPARLALVWLEDAADASRRLGLRPAEAGANVLLIEPVDPLVFEGATRREGVWYAAPSQTAADLLTSPGRGPAEGEELIGWMIEHEDEWRR
jgi:hypothetical protein